MLPSQTTIGWVGPQDLYWGWIQDCLPGIEIVAPTDALHWLSSGKGVLAISLHGRVDTQWELVETLHREQSSVVPANGTKSKVKRTADKEPRMPSRSPWFVVLGEDWAGHRRTRPLPEDMIAFYWYELFDQLLPWLSSQSPTTKEFPKRRVDRILESSMRLTDSKVTSFTALVRTDSATESQLWMEVLASMGILSLDLPSGGRGSRLKPDCVIMDLEERPRASWPNQSDRTGRILNEWTELQNRFPTALRVMVDSFPRWSDWQQFLDAGVDVILPKPFSTYGLEWCLRQWIAPVESKADPSSRHVQ